MPKEYLLPVITAIGLAMSTSSYATDLPKACQNTLLSRNCQSDPNLELALENDLWQAIGTGNITAISTWQNKVRTYLINVKKLSNKGRSRLHTLLAFSQVDMYVNGNMFDPFNLSRMLDARISTGIAVKLNSSYTNAGHLNNYLNAYIGYASSTTPIGDYFINQLYKTAEQGGDMASGEGELIGAMAQMLLSDDTKVKQGLSKLKDCTTLRCKNYFHIAPYKEVGMQIAIAEGYARLGDMQNMQAAFNRAKTYAQQYNHPYPQLIDTMQNQLTSTGGTIEQWKQNKHLGDIKLPLPPSAGALACQVCHATARQTINHFK